MTPENLSSRLEGELRGKAPEEQWGILVDVRSYLLGGGEEGEEEEGSMLSPEDQAQYDAWTPSERQLEREWAQLMSNVPPEEADEVNPDFDRAPYEDRKRMVWDVRQYLAPHDEPDPTKPVAPSTQNRKPPPPPRPPTDAELASVGPNEMRRRGGPNRGRDYERAMELGFDSRDADENGFRQDYYGKEKGRRRGGGGSSYLAMGIACMLGTALVLLVSAAALAEDGEPIGESFMRLVRLS